MLMGTSELAVVPQRTKPPSNTHPSLRSASGPRCTALNPAPLGPNIERVPNQGGKRGDRLAEGSPTGEEKSSRRIFAKKTAHRGQRQIP
jgi:hypothetical protein